MSAIPESGATPKTWDAPEYQRRHSYIWRYGADMIEMLAPQPGESILDLGCGTGHLSAEIAASGAQVLGVDSSAEMVRTAQANFPHLHFRVADARALDLGQRFDAVFSNAVLHWIKETEQALDSIAACLKPGGRMVAEMGGAGNIAGVVGALRRALTATIGHPRADVDPWYFPTIGEYARLLEARDFELSYAAHFDRPTPQEEGEAGLRDWVRMFCSDFLSGLDPETETRVLERVEDELRPAMFDGVRWTVDYRRLRFEARKISGGSR